MLKCALLLVAVSVAHAQVDRCCTPDRWEGLVEGMYGDVREGRPNYGRTEDEVFYDYTGKKFAWFHRTIYHDGTDRSFRLIDDHAMRRRYMIADNRCEYEESSGEMRKDCISHEAEYRGEVYFGSGSEALAATRWETRYEEGATVFSRTLREHGCVPINAIRFLNAAEARPVPFDYAGSLLFHAIQPSIRDPDVFVPPEGCVPRPPGTVAARLVDDAGYQTLRGLHYL